MVLRLSHMSTDQLTEGFSEGRHIIWTCEVQIGLMQVRKCLEVGFIMFIYVAFSKVIRGL